jgi:hypothetical protein
VDDDIHMIRIIEGRGAAIEGGIIEFPFRRGDSPDQLRKIVPVFVVACPATVGGKIVLIPPLELRARRQRYLPASWLPIR